MVLSQEEAEKIKKHLLKQLGNLPPEKSEEIKEKVESMPVQEVEEFVKENNLTHLGGQCLFCAITNNKMPSVKVLENEENIAILEINPLSKGHSLIVPIKHLKEPLKSTEKLAKELASKISKKFSPKEVQIRPLKIMEHGMFEVIPLYGNETEKKPATEEELLSIQEELSKPIEEIKIEPIKEVIPPKKEEKEVYYRLPPRIP